MFLRLLLLFTVVPLVELGLLIEVGRHVGTWTTVGIVLGTGVAGAWLARLTGLRTLGRIQRTMAAGQIPTTDLIDGLIILVAGAMLVTPGLLTDVTALTVLSPPGRRIVRARLGRWIRRRIEDAAAGGGVVIDVPPTGAGHDGDTP